MTRLAVVFTIDEGVSVEQAETALEEMVTLGPVSCSVLDIRGHRESPRPLHMTAGRPEHHTRHGRPAMTRRIPEMELFTGYSPSIDLPRHEGAGTSFLLTVHDDGTHEVAVRPGYERRDLIWSPPVTLQREPVEVSR